MAESLKSQVAPKSPQGAPAHVQHLLSKLSESLDLDAPRTAFLALRENLIYLLEFFAAVAAAAADQSQALDAKSKALWKAGASLTDIENLLTASLSALEPQRTNPAIGNLRSVFFVGDTTSKPSPRRHSRLLRIAGAPFRGYVFLSEFAELKPATRDAFAAEVKRYLPILKEWLTAAAPFFKDLKVVEEGVTSEGLQQITVELGSFKLDLGDAIRVHECSLCPVAAKRAEPAKAAVARAAGAAKPAAKSTTVAKPATAGAKKPEEGGATPVKSPVVKKVLVVKRPDGTIVRKVVQTVSASEVAKARSAAEAAKAPAKTAEAAPAPRPNLISPQDAPDKAKPPVKPTVVKKVVPAAKKEEAVEAAPLEMARPASMAELARELSEAAEKPAEKPSEPAPAKPEPPKPPSSRVPTTRLPTAPRPAETSSKAVEKPAPESKSSALEKPSQTEESKPAPVEPPAKPSPQETADAEPEKDSTPAVEPTPAKEEPPIEASSAPAETPPVAEPSQVPTAEEAPAPAPVETPEPASAPAVEEESSAPPASPEPAEAREEAPPEVEPAEEKTSRPDPGKSGSVKPPSFKLPGKSVSPPSGSLSRPAVKPPRSSESGAVEVAAVKPPVEQEPAPAPAAEPQAEEAPAPPEPTPSEPSPAEVAPAEAPPEVPAPVAESEAPPQPQPGKVSPEPEPSEPVEAAEIEAVEPAPSPDPVSSLGGLELAEELGEDELLLGAPEEGDIVLEEVLVSEDDLLLGAPEEYEVEEVSAPEPAPAAVSLSSIAPLSSPTGAPDHLKHLVDGLNAALKNNELDAAAYAVQSTYDFLIRYFAGVAASCWQTASRKLPDNAKALMRGWSSLGACRELLAMSLPKLSGGDGITTALVASFKGPLADRIQRGPDIAAWCERNLEGNQTAANEALNVYLGEIRDFFKKSEDYFEGCEHFSEPPSAKGHLEVVVQFGEAFLELCEPDYVIQIRRCPVCLPNFNAAAAPVAPAPVVEEKVAAPELANLLFGGAPEEVGGGAPLLGAAAKPETLVLKLGGPDPAPAKSGIFAGLSKKLKVNVPAPMAALGLEVPENIPEHLGHILNRVSYGMGHQDPQETSLSVRDALEFLVRYFAGVAGLAARKLEKETPELKAAFIAEPMSVSRCEQVLFQALKALATSDDSLAALLRQTFPTGSGDAHTKTITLDVENRLRALGKFCSQTQAGWDKVRCIRENSRFLPVLKDWLAASKPFFKAVETHAEAPSDDGRMDVVVEHKDHFLELIAPEYTLLIRRCPVCLPTYEGNDPPVPEEDAASAEVPRPGTVSPQPEATTASLGGVKRLDDAMDDLLKGKAPAAAESAEAKPGDEPKKPRPGLVSAADDEEPAMAHDVSYIGSGKAKEDGRIFHGGYINVVNVGGGMLSATVRPTHPCVTVKPVRFKGKHCRIEYQIDEADLPSSRKVYVVIRSANEERQIPIWQMLPPTSTLSMSDRALRTFMAIPMIVYMFIFMIIHTQSNRLVEGILRTALRPEDFQRGGDFLEHVKLPPEVVGNMANIAQFDGTFFIMFAGVVPWLVAKIFSMAPPDQIHRNRKWFIGYLVAPLIWVTLVIIPLFHVFVVRPELKPMHFASTGMYLWFVFLNGLSAYYLYISRMNELEQWIQFAFMRKVIGVVVLLVWCLCAMSAIFLR